ncbi:hypothetical protein [Aliiglaciecola litoralis]|uniref:Uncharacterized protein n=1 Tax=Aliiglaciecola litoralis TaxID=582857 RepID=A0ABP3X3L8_9ALTE
MTESNISIPTPAKINILKIATCGKVSTPTEHTLTYNIGYDTDPKTLLVRITDNDTGGLFSNEWISLDDIVTAIEKRPTPDTSFNAKIFSSLFKSQSANNAGFLVAALKAENILVPFKESKRLHDIGDIKTFESKMQKLIKEKVSLHDVVAERDAAKAKVRAENERKLAALKAKKAAQPISK